MEPDGGEMGNASCLSKTRWLCAQTGPLAPPTVSGQRRPARNLRRQRRGRWGDAGVGGWPRGGPGLLSSERGARAGAGAEVPPARPACGDGACGLLSEPRKTAVCRRTEPSSPAGDAREVCVPHWPLLRPHRGPAARPAPDTGTDRAQARKPQAARPARRPPDPAPRPGPMIRGPFPRQARLTYQLSSSSRPAAQRFCLGLKKLDVPTQDPQGCENEKARRDGSHWPGRPAGPGQNSWVRGQGACRRHQGSQWTQRLWKRSH